MVKNRGARGSRLPSDLCARLSDGSRGCFFSQYPTSEPTDPAVHAAVNFLTSSDCSTSVFAATTHKPVCLSSLNSSEREGVREADAKGDKGWQDRQVYERVSLTAVPPDVQRIPLQRVRTEKLRDDGTRIFKTRTVIRGDLVNRIGLDITIHLCPPNAVHLVLQLVLDLCKRRSVSLSLKKADVVQAYLQAPLPSSRVPVYVLPPPDHPDRGHHFCKLLKAVYGLSDAGKVFEDFLSSKLRELGWSTTLFPGVWFLRGADGEICGILCTYVDDLLLIGIGEDAADLSGLLRDHVMCGDDTDTISGRFVGVQFDVTADGILIHQHDYISSLSLPPEFSSSESRPADKPLPVGATHKENISPPLDAAGARVYRELLGQVGYVAYCTRPDVSLAHSYLSRFMAAPTERAFRLLLQMIRYLRSTPSLGIPIRPSLNPDELIAVIHADASFGTPDSPHPQTGWLLFLQGSPLLYKSRRQSHVVRSTTRAEVLALEDAIDASLHFAACLIPFYKSVKIGIGCDAANVLHLLQSGGASSVERALLPLVRRLGDRACVVPLLAVTDLTEQHKVGIFKIPMDVNVSDILTKARDIGLLSRLLSLSADAPELFGLAECSRVPPLSLTL